MQQYVCVYLHGFLSSGNSEKGQWLKRKVLGSSKNAVKHHNAAMFSDVLTPTYPIKSPVETAQSIESFLNELTQKGESIVLMGSSMGGYYAQYLGQKYKIPYIMINPALRPEPIFRASLGKHINPVTNEVFTMDEKYIMGVAEYDVGDIDRSVQTLLLIDSDDEVIDVDFAIQRYGVVDSTDESSGHYCTIYSGGDHRFIHMQQAWSEIQKFINRL